MRPHDSEEMVVSGVTHNTYIVRHGREPGRVCLGWEALTLPESPYRFCVTIWNPGVQRGVIYYHIYLEDISRGPYVGKVIAKICIGWDIIGICLPVFSCIACVPSIWAFKYLSPAI